MSKAATKIHHLKIFLSNRYAYAQAVRMTDGHIIAAASTAQKNVSEGLSSKVDLTACTKVGEALAQRLKEVGVEGVHWQRKNGQRFHGRIARLLEAMQEGGVKLV